MQRTTQQVRLKQRPDGLTDDNTWELTHTEVPEISDGQFVVDVQYISVDPAMRGWLNDVRSYIPPVQIGEVMRAIGVGTVTKSRHPDFAVRTTVRGSFGVTDVAISDGDDVTTVDVSVAPGTTWLGALGMPGMTAYFGLFEIGKIRAGETLLVSGAAGAVGSIAGQIGKLKGATVIGIAGGPEKCDWLTNDLDFDHAIDYKNEHVLRRLREIAPDGVDVYFDNVGGPTLDAALANLARGARIVICGSISSYNEDALPPGPSRYMSLLVFRASMTGFVVFDYADRFDEAITDLAAWIANGEIIAHEHVVAGGISAFGETLNMLFAGRNFGKLVLKT